MRDGEEVRLTPKEFELLTFLAQHPGRVLTHRAIMKAIWGPHACDQPEHLRVLVAALRKKIEPDPSVPKYILTEPWVGYRFAESLSLRSGQARRATSTTSMTLMPTNGRSTPPTP